MRLNAVLLGCALLVSSPVYAQQRAFKTVYCSEDNTGEASNHRTDIYNSYSQCFDFCSSGNYTYSILQSYECFCSNEAPTNKQSLDSCSETCPGWAHDTCGNESENFFQYIQVGDGDLSTDSGLSTSQSSFPSPTVSHSGSLPSDSRIPGLTSQSVYFSSDNTGAYSSDGPTPSPTLASSATVSSASGSPTHPPPTTTTKSPTSSATKLLTETTGLFLLSALLLCFVQLQLA